MVASGVPERNGVAHATEIAEMSLELVALIKQVAAMNNRPEVVSLRIGLHSGTVGVSTGCGRGCVHPTSATPEMAK